LAIDVIKNQVVKTFLLLDLNLNETAQTDML